MMTSQLSENAGFEFTVKWDGEVTFQKVYDEELLSLAMDNFILDVGGLDLGMILEIKENVDSEEWIQQDDPQEHLISDEHIPDTEDSDEENDLLPHKFRWINRLKCVETLAYECVDNGDQYNKALRTVKLGDFSSNTDKILIKHMNALRKDVLKLSKEIRTMRESAEVGDVVKVPLLISGPLGLQRVGRKLVEAVIIDRIRIGRSYSYTVLRRDSGTQIGNGHMIKAIVSRGGQTEVYADGSSDES